MLLTGSKEIRELAKEAWKKPGLYTRSPWLLRASLAFSINIALGNIEEVVIEGKEDLLAAAQEAHKSQKGIVIPTSHITDPDVFTIQLLASQVLDVGASFASTNLDYPDQRFLYRFGGINKAYYPIPYQSPKGRVSRKIPRKPQPFSPEDYCEMIGALNKGRSIAVAAHRPLHGLPTNDGRLPKYAGVAAAHLALLSDNDPLIALMQISRQEENPQRFNADEFKILEILSKKAVRFAFMRLGRTKQERENYLDVHTDALAAIQKTGEGGVALKKQITQARQFGENILETMRGSYTPKF